MKTLLTKLANGSELNLETFAIKFREIEARRGVKNAVQVYGILGDYYAALSRLNLGVVLGLTSFPSVVAGTTTGRKFSELRTRIFKDLDWLHSAHPGLLVGVRTVQVLKADDHKTNAELYDHGQALIQRFSVLAERPVAQVVRSIEPTPVVKPDNHVEDDHVKMERFMSSGKTFDLSDTASDTRYLFTAFVYDEQSDDLITQESMIVRGSTMDEATRNLLGKLRGKLQDITTPNVKVHLQFITKWTVEASAPLSTEDVLTNAIKRAMAEKTT